MPDAGAALTSRLVDGLYAEALALTERTRAYFDGEGRAVRTDMPPLARVAFACEAMKGTTRLMLVIAWLLDRRAVDAGEIPEGDPRGPQRRLGEAPDATPVEHIPPAAARLLAAGVDLYERVARLDRGLDAPAAEESPARSLLRRLERSI